MAANYTLINEQTVAPNQPVVFTSSPVPCNRGLIFHNDGSGIFKLASMIRSCGCGCNSPQYETRYLVEFNGNIAIPPTGGTVEEIQLAISVDGETEPASIMRLTPAAVDTYGDVGTSIIVRVPSICGCESMSVRNISTQDILIQNASLVIDLVGVQRVR